MFALDNLLIRQGGFELRADWSIPAGRKLALIGPSGEGKTTLLSAIAGFVAPVSGDICLKGARLTTLAPAARPVSLLFQSHNLFAHLSVFQNVALGVRPDLKLDAAQRSGVTAALERVGLADKAAQFPAALSGGQAQRAALARALLRDRPLLLLDEPFAALGPALRAEMLDLVDEIVSQTCATLLMVTHDPVDARRLGDLTALVADGIVHAPRPTPELFADPPEALRAYLG